MLDVYRAHILQQRFAQFAVIIRRLGHNHDAVVGESFDDTGTLEIQSEISISHIAAALQHDHGIRRNGLTVVGQCIPPIVLDVLLDFTQIDTLQVRLLSDGDGQVTDIAVERSLTEQDGKGLRRLGRLRLLLASTHPRPIQQPTDAIGSDKTEHGKFRKTEQTVLRCRHSLTPYAWIPLTNYAS